MSNLFPDLLTASAAREAINTRLSLRRAARLADMHSRTQKSIKEAYGRNQLRVVVHYNTRDWDNGAEAREELQKLASELTDMGYVTELELASTGGHNCTPHHLIVSWDRPL